MVVCALIRLFSPMFHVKRPTALSTTITGQTNVQPHRANSRGSLQRAHQRAARVGSDLTHRRVVRTGPMMRITRGLFRRSMVSGSQRLFHEKHAVQEFARMNGHLLPHACSAPRVLVPQSRPDPGAQIGMCAWAREADTAGNGTPTEAVPWDACRSLETGASVAGAMGPEAASA